MVWAGLGWGGGGGGVVVSDFFFLRESILEGWGDFSIN